jgi:ribonuclease R
VFLTSNEEKYTFSAIFEITETHKWSINGLEERSFIQIVFCLRGSAVYHRNEGRHDSEEISITVHYQVSAEIVAATLKMDELAKILENKEWLMGNYF